MGLISQVATIPQDTNGGMLEELEAVQKAQHELAGITALFIYPSRVVLVCSWNNYSQKLDYGFFFGPNTGSRQNVK